MAAKWIEALTGSLEQKKQYRQYRARVEALPEPYAAVAKAVDRYLMYQGGVTDGETMVRMLDDLADLFDGAAADGLAIRDIVGEDPVEFAEAFVRAYTTREWIDKERTRLRRAVDDATGGERS
ncbi:DUF1048 domain-containing protein [Microbacterium sp. NPDC055683]